MAAVPPLTDTPLARVLAALDGRGLKRVGRGWTARCPAHEDRSPSLSVTEGRDGRVVLHCHAGCPAARVVEALGMTMADLFTGDGGPYRAPAPAVHPQGYQMPAERPSAAPKGERRIVCTYDYTDADGTLLFQVVRFDPKDFRQRKPDGKGGWVWSLGETEPVLYRLPEVIEAVALERPVYIVEGEKDADTLAELGYAATTSPMGAGKWREAYAAVLRGATVHILPDHDDVGRAHAEQIAASCAAAGCTVRIVELPALRPKGDVTDWLDDGHDLDNLDAVVQATPVWRDPSAPPRTRWRLDELWADDHVMRPPPPVVPRFAWGSRSTLLAAGEKVGKSTLCGAMAAAVSRGAAFLDDPCEQGDVLIVGLEEFIGDVGRRLRQFKADPARIHLVDRLPADPRERPQVLAQHVAEVKPALVIVDTLMAYAEGVISDASSSSQMQPVVQRLTRLAHEAAVALILVHHARKSDGKYRDSSAIGGAVDVIVEVFQPPETEAADPTLRKARARGRVPVSDFSFRFDGTTYHLAAGDGASVETRILDYVRANPHVSHRAVRTHIGGRAETVDQVLTRLLQAGRLIDDGTGEHRKYRIPAYGGANLRTGAVEW